MYYAAGVNQSNKGKILSAFYYGYASSQVPGGWIAQKIGGRRVLLLSFVLWTLTCALVPLDPKPSHNFGDGSFTRRCGTRVHLPVHPQRVSSMDPTS
ncbi:unnamed protein product [Camellia sinensis]